MSNTKQQNQPDPVEMLYIESPSISLKQFREAIDRLVTEARKETEQQCYIYMENGRVQDYKNRRDGTFQNDPRLKRANLESQLTDKEEK